ncbi:hypothetical protein [Thermocrispum municipale]|jgi:hypothetical protein|uniref:hypothetical protein n=1 Tax=Thermocrispum municipale TaxID=37926 RepID=UPI0004022EB8|nr:hypothetical protein [Thermocrispum municipale]
MNWLVPLVLVLAIAPIATCVWWWLRSRKDEQRKAAARAKMTRYLRDRHDEKPSRTPAHALPDGHERTVELSRRRTPSAAARQLVRTQVSRHRAPEPALTMITRGAHPRSRAAGSFSGRL